MRARPHPPGVAVLAGIATTVLSGWQLLVAPVVGMADNGDYLRVLRHVGIDVVPRLASPDAATRTGYVSLAWHHAPNIPSTDGFFSTEVPLVRLALRLGGYGGGNDVWDLRWLGAVHAVLLGAGVWLVLRALPGRRPARILAAVVLVAAFADSAFVVYLNSLYSEPATLFGLLLVVAAGLHQWRRPARSVTGALLGMLAILVAGLALVLSKSEAAPLAAPLAVAVVCRAHPVGRLRGRLGERTVPALVALALVVVAVGYVGFQPRELARANLYDSVFYEALVHAERPVDELRQLGLDPALARWQGSSFFARPNALTDPAFHGFYQQVSYGSVARLYLAHPHQAGSLVKRGLLASTEIRPDYLGNYSVGSGRPPRTIACRLCGYSRLARLLRPAAPVLVPLLYLGALAAGVALRRERRSPRSRGYRGLADVLLLLAVTGPLELLTALVGEGGYELVKHLYLFDAITAVTAALTLVAAVSILGKARQR